MVTSLKVIMVLYVYVYIYISFFFLFISLFILLLLFIFLLPFFFFCSYCYYHYDLNHYYFRFINHLLSEQDIYINKICWSKYLKKKKLFLATISVVLYNLLQCVDKALYAKFTCTAEIKNYLNQLKKRKC